MHAVVIESLEEYLSGALEPAAQRKIESHLSACNSCREELHGMQDVSQLFVSLKSDEDFDLSPGFYAGVKQQVGSRQAAPAFGGLFQLDFLFGRRLALASLLMFAILGSYLVSSEVAYSSGPSPDAVMAQQDSPAFETAPARDNMLVTLTAYEQH